jgi:hypothetical protein
MYHIYFDTVTQIVHLETDSWPSDPRGITLKIVELLRLAAMYMSAMNVEKL